MLGLHKKTALLKTDVNKTRSRNIGMSNKQIKQLFRVAKYRKVNSVEMYPNEFKYS